MIQAQLAWVVLLFMFIETAAYTPPFQEGDVVLTLAPLAFALVGLAGLVIGHRIALQATLTQNEPLQALQIMINVRGAFYIVSGVFGAALSVLGAPLFVYLPFIGAATLALLWTFPTTSRLTKLLAVISSVRDEAGRTE